MNYDKCRQWSLVFLRLVVAVTFIWHGLPKIMSPQGPMGFFASLGFPGFLAPVVGVVEVAAGVLLLIGLWHRYAAYALSVIIAVAILRVQLPAAISAGDLIVPFARDVLLLAALLVIAFHGPGCCAVDSKRDDRKRR